MGSIGAPSLVFGPMGLRLSRAGAELTGVRPHGPEALQDAPTLGFNTGSTHRREALQKASAMGTEWVQYKHWQHWSAAPGVRPLGLRLSRAGATLFWCSALGA
jgi:hypothetical protein